MNVNTNIWICAAFNIQKPFDFFYEINFALTITFLEVMPYGEFV